MNNSAFSRTTPASHKFRQMLHLSIVFEDRKHNGLNRMGVTIWAQEYPNLRLLAAKHCCSKYTLSLCLPFLLLEIVVPLRRGPRLSATLHLGVSSCRIETQETPASYIVRRFMWKVSPEPLTCHKTPLRALTVASTTSSTWSASGPTTDAGIGHLK